MKNIFITGAHGMLGKNLTHKFNNKSFSNFKIFSPTKKEVNLLNLNKIKQFITRNKIDTVIHCASLVGGILDNKNKLKEYLINNTEINKNILIASSSLGVKNFINIGSSCMYPKNVRSFLKESMIFDGKLEPTNEGHALSKIFSAKLCSYIDEGNKEFNYKTLVPCNLYGDYDNFDLESSHFVPAIIRKIYEAKKYNQDVIEIWGDGKSKRECMHVKDLVDAIVFCMHRIENIPTIINIGTGKDHSIFEIYKMAAKIMKIECDWTFNKKMPTGMRRKVLNVKLINGLGWHSKIDIEKGLRSTFDFYSKTYS